MPSIPQAPLATTFVHGLRFERIETDAEPGDVGAERHRELKTKRDEVVRGLAKLRPPHTVPPYSYKTETIQRFKNPAA